MTDEIVFEAGWFDYEAHGHITIYSRPDHTLYYIEEGSCPMAEEQNFEYGPCDITLDEAIDLMIEWEEEEMKNQELWEQRGSLF